MFFTLSYLTITLLPITAFGFAFNALMVCLAVWHIALLRLNKQGVRNAILNAVALVGMAITVMSIGIKSTVSVFVALMLLACQLKVLQAKTLRQWRQVLVLNFFTFSCAFLFSQSLYIALLVLFMLGFNLVLMQTLQHVGTIKATSQFVVSKILLSCVLSVLLILFLPKLPAFWQLPGPQLAKTGLSETVSPFSISQLSQSDELAFRAIFNDVDIQQGQTPLYWRAIIHDEFDGQQWHIANLQKATINYEKSGGQPTYSIIAQPSNTPWLYALGFASSSTNNVQSNYFGTLFRTDRLTATLEYVVTPAKVDASPTMSRWQYQHNTAIPKQLNLRAQRLAQQWDKQSGTTAEFIALMRKYFVEQGFSYTLTPQVATSEHMIDQFLFDYKSGFCGHYASTVAMMMRSVGIPARLVSGYLGAEYNEKQGYFSIYQYDAHAWVEYFVPNEGWKRLDPTAWVSPERLQGSLSQYQPLANQFQSNLGMSLAAFSSFPAINWLRLKLEELDYQWTRWVLNFDRQKQSSMLEAMLGKNNQHLSGVIAIITLGIIFTGIFFYIQFNSRIKEPDAIKHYRRLCSFSSIDLEHTPPKQSIEQLQQQFPEQSADLMQFYADFCANRYQGKTFGKNQNIHAKNLINSIKTKAKRTI
nr:DUF3488 and transglutaminase-like domain-containing protein [Pseudoalteromonas sp. S16_S37]